MRMLLKSIAPDVDRHLKNFRAVCGGNELCHNNQLIRCIPGGRPGLHVGQTWFCCVDCFVFAARTPLERLLSRQVVEIPRHPRLSLGLYLTSKGYLTGEQFRIAMTQSQSFDVGVEETLVRLGMAQQRGNLPAPGRLNGDIQYWPRSISAK